MKKQSIITISRQYGSGGREIGQRLAKALEIPFYDKELIELASQESGIDAAVFKDAENRTSRGFYFLGAVGYTLGSPMTISSEMSLSDQVYKIQSDVIKEVASKGPCVIVGRCADGVLEKYDNVINIFVHGDIGDRIERAKNEYLEDEDEDYADDELEDFVIKMDKKRANYYEYYTERKWGRVENYHLSYDTSKFGVENTIKMILFDLKLNEE